MIFQAERDSATREEKHLNCHPKLLAVLCALQQLVVVPGLGTLSQAKKALRDLKQWAGEPREIRGTAAVVPLMQRGPCATTTATTDFLMSTKIYRIQ